MIVDGIKDQARRVGSIGDFIKEQRELAQFSMRQLASLAGVSNPYLSQIERGLRKPSAEILHRQGPADLGRAAVRPRRDPGDPGR